MAVLAPPTKCARAPTLSMRAHVRRTRAAASGDASAVATDAAALPALRFAAAASIVPHPDKVAKGGEDACFVGDCGTALGLADGVGGWAEDGIDPADYARALVAAMDEGAAAATGVTPREGETDGAVGTAAARAVLEHAHAACMTVPGAATAVLALARGRTLCVANLGDSGVRCGCCRDECACSRLLFSPFFPFFFLRAMYIILRVRARMCTCVMQAPSRWEDHPHDSAAAALLGLPLSIWFG